VRGTDADLDLTLPPATTTINKRTQNSAHLSQNGGSRGQWDRGVEGGGGGIYTNVVILVESDFCIFESLLQENAPNRKMKMLTPMEYFCAFCSF
jgi:hypothetical protein